MTRQLPELSLVEKLLHTGLIFVVGLGLLVAEAYVYVTNAGLDGKSGLAVQDIVISYYGNRTTSRLQVKLPTMMGYAQVPVADRPAVTARVDRWVAGDQGKAEYEHSIKPIFNAYCMKCHSAAMSQQLHIPPLASYEDVKAVAKVHTGMNLTTKLLSGMVHLTMLGVIFWVTGGIFLRARFPELLKGVLIVTPFIAMLVDFAGWFLTQQAPVFAWLVLIGGILSCPVALLMMAISLFQMWFMKPKAV